MNDDERIVPLRKPGGSCPICGGAAAPGERPFCSPRCADIDLGRWLKGGYCIPTDEAPDDGAGSPDA